MHIEVGTPVLLESGANRDRVKGIYVGAVGTQHVIFSVPLTAGIRGRMRVGNRVTVRYIAKGTVYGFHSTISEFKAEPAPLLFLDYPDRVEEMEIREHSRVDCYFPASIRTKGGGIIEGLIVDISLGGCRLTFETDPDAPPPSLDKGSRITADFYILEERNSYTLKAELMHMLKQGNKLCLGLKFECEDQFKDLVKEYVAKVHKMLG